MIAFDAVTKRYGDNVRPALDNISLDIQSGEFIVMVGQSGSGKSTLLGMINRLIDPSEGVVWFEGEDVQHLDPVLLRRHIGYVFQHVGLFPHMTLAENIGITPRLLGWDEARIAARTEELLTLVQLPPEQYRDRIPSELSGGQRQRIGVARAIAAKPRVVLMDEPFGALDLRTRDALSRDYRKLHEALQLTTVMITHDVIEAVLLADRIAVLQDGRIAGLGTPHDLVTNPPNDDVRALMDMPRQQAERLNALMRESAAS
ncbi:ATP-binding cassette domain-containing protein [Pseudorhodoplanes sinuspersici]|uniref:ABC transporter ATP-binding protein n=1 Tax=Pseudorhodoplanes sinuspersici TaxID=1235591 RepID=A0A1W6ZS00_9HYPH|nr:ATP-binding cassette domain-containing protein [Pseudorhodoplanes sinuspersici]ARQ00189.1 ABC transporter ATP-binding protein [Pseudorhodoplanes sinuspersici]RKE67675.1 osmoprotectant transport system ATP-binding protein [Pseudorhodoplanes sinuspersici]